MEAARPGGDGGGAAAAGFDTTLWSDLPDDAFLDDFVPGDGAAVVDGGDDDDGLLHGLADAAHPAAAAVPAVARAPQGVRLDHHRARIEALTAFHTHVNTLAEPATSAQWLPLDQRLPVYISDLGHARAQLHDVDHLVYETVVRNMHGPLAYMRAQNHVVMQRCGVQLTLATPRLVHGAVSETLATLAPNEWLNDTVVNMCVELWNNRFGGKLSEQRVPRVSRAARAFASSVYTLTIGRGSDAWTPLRDVDLASYAMLLFVIHETAHWSLLVFRREPWQPDALTYECFVSDSLAPSRAATLQRATAIARWIRFQVRARHGEALAESVRTNVVEDNNISLPQTNTSDCGVFALGNMVREMGMTHALCKRAYFVDFAQGRAAREIDDEARATEGEWVRTIDGSTANHWRKCIALELLTTHVPIGQAT